MILPSEGWRIGSFARKREREKDMLWERKGYIKRESR